MPSWKAELCADIVAKPLAWLWPGYLARGKLALLDGDPEVGKSLLSLDLIARLSCGGPLPDGSPLPDPCTSLLLSTEDDAADTIRPRAEAAGGDLSRLVLPDFAGRTPRFPDDLPALEDTIREQAVDLVAIDPLMAFLPPRVAANLDQCVRGALTPLADLAARTDCAVLFVRHLTKRNLGRAIRRGQGSMGILAAVRTALFVAARPGDPGGRVLTVAKSNFGRHPPARGFRVVETSGQPVVEWTGPLALTADEASRADGEGLRPRERAADWLRRELAGGPRKSADLYAAAAAAGIPERTLERAKAEAQVGSQQVRGAHGNEWWWYDPAGVWPKDAPFKKPFELPPLDPL